MRLHLSYDQLYIGKVYTNIVMASYDSENCQKLELEGFSRNDLRMNNSMVPKRQTNTTNQNHSFELVTQDWLNLYFRIIARDDSNILCSDSHTGRVYYHFNGNLLLIQANPFLLYKSLVHVNLFHLVASCQM